MSYKPPRPEEKGGHSSVGPHEKGAFVTVFKILLGFTISVTLLVLFLASAGLAYVVLFTGPEILITDQADGTVEISVTEGRRESIERVRIRAAGGPIVWEVEAEDRTMGLPTLRIRAGGNPVDPGLGGPVSILHPRTGTAFEIDRAVPYEVTIWGPNEAGGRGSTTATFTIAATR